MLPFGVGGQRSDVWRMSRHSGYNANQVYCAPMTMATTSNKGDYYKMKKKSILFLAAVIVLFLTTYAFLSTRPNSAKTAISDTVPEPDLVTITALNAAKEPIEIKVPYNPQRVAVMDMAVLDMLDNWNLGDRVVGIAKNIYVDYLETYRDNDGVRDLGTLHEPDLEAMMAAKPDIIFIGNRMAPKYDALSKIAPVVYVGLDYKVGLIQSMENNVGNIAKIFNMQETAGVQLSDLKTRVRELATAASGKTAVIGVVSNGGLNTLGNASRCSIIGNEVGFKNLAVDVNATHGNESSFELLIELNPDYIFVLDRDSAVRTNGARLAEDVMENELVQKTSAYQNNQIVYLTPAPWYLAEGGITAMDAILSDLEGALIN